MGFAQQPGAELDAPMGQILRRRQPEKIHEPLMERGTRQANLAGEIVDTPGVIRTFVQQRERLADDPIAQSRQPPGRVLGQAIEVAADDIDKHHFRKALQHRVAAGPAFVRLHHRLVDHARDPVACARCRQMQLRDLLDTGILRQPDGPPLP